MILNEDFENLSFDSTSYNDTQLTNSDSPFMFENEIDDIFPDIKNSHLSFLHLNIRSLKANFENFKTFLDSCNTSFNIICLSETWLSNQAFHSDSDFFLANYRARLKFLQGMF